VRHFSRSNSRLFCCACWFAELLEPFVLVDLQPFFCRCSNFWSVSQNHNKMPPKKAAASPARGRSPATKKTATPAKAASKSPAMKRSAAAEKSPAPKSAAKKAAAAPAPASPAAVASVAAPSPRRSPAPAAPKASPKVAAAAASSPKVDQLVTVGGVTSALGSAIYSQMKPAKAILSARTQGLLSIVPLVSIGYLTFSSHLQKKGGLERGSYAVAVLAFIVASVVREMVSLQGFANSVVDFLPWLALAHAIHRQSKRFSVGAFAVVAALLALDAFTSKGSAVATLKALYVPAHPTLASALPALSRLLSLLSSSVAIERAIHAWRANKGLSAGAVETAVATVLLSPIFSAHIQPVLLGLLPLEAKTLKELATWLGVFLLSDSTN
jgi:hypothetical protein